MTAKPRHFVATLLGTGLLVLLLMLASLDSFFEVEPPPLTILREVKMYVPAPMPVSKEQNAANSGTSLQLATLESSVVLQTMSLEVDLQGGQMNGFGSGIAELGDGSGMNWGAVGFSDLDGFPMILNSPTLVYPPRAITNTIKEFEVTFHILIDEEGKTYPIQIVENPYPAIASELMDYATSVIFTPPTQLGVPVKTEYLWPVIFKRN